MSFADKLFEKIGEDDPPQESGEGGSVSQYGSIPGADDGPYTQPPSEGYTNRPPSESDQTQYDPATRSGGGGSLQYQPLTGADGGSSPYAPAQKGAAAGSYQELPAKSQSSERKGAWVCGMWTVAVVAASVFVLALLGSIFHYLCFTRTQVLTGELSPMPDDPESRQDTQTRYTAANILSGPLQPPALFFAAMALAYLPARYFDSKRVVGYIGGVEYTSFLVTWAVAIAWLIVFLVQQARLTTSADELHSAADDTYEWDNEENIPYEIYWFISPLAGWVVGHNAYILGALILIMVILTVVYCVQAGGSRGRFQGQQTYGDEAEGLVEPKNTAEGGSGFFYAFLVLTVLFALTCLSHLLLVLFTVMSSLISAEVTIGMDLVPLQYWMVFVNTVHVSLFFFYAGWFAFFAISNGWWIYPSFTSGERTIARVTAFITSLVGALVLVFGILHVIEVFEDCKDDVFSFVEGDTELKFGVCNLISNERDAAFGVFIWLRVNAIVFTAITAALLVTSIASFVYVMRSDVLNPQEKKRFLPSNAVAAKRQRTTMASLLSGISAPYYAKDSGEDTASEVESKSVVAAKARKRSIFEEMSDEN